MKLILPIFWHSDESSKKEDLGIEAKDISEFDTREVIFYRIDVITDYMEDGAVVGSRIFSSGESFICPLRKEEIDNRICSQGSTYNRN